MQNESSHIGMTKIISPESKFSLTKDEARIKRLIDRYKGGPNLEKLLSKNFENALADNNENSEAIKQTEEAIDKECQVLSSTGLTSDSKLLQSKKQKLSVQYFAKYSQSIEKDIQSLLKLDPLPSNQYVSDFNLSQALYKYDKVYKLLLQHLEYKSQETKHDNDNLSREALFVKKIKQDINHAISCRIDFFEDSYQKNKSLKHRIRIFHEFCLFYMPLLYGKIDSSFDPVIKTRIDCLREKMNIFIINEIEKIKSQLITMVESVGWNKKSNNQEDIFIQKKTLLYKCNKIISHLNSTHISRISVTSFGGRIKEIQEIPSKIYEKARKKELLLMEYFDQQCDDALKQLQMIENNPNHNDIKKPNSHLTRKLETIANFLIHKVENYPPRVLARIRCRVVRKSISMDKKQNIFFTPQGKLRKEFTHPSLVEFLCGSAIKELNKHNWWGVGAVHYCLRNSFMDKIYNMNRQPDIKISIDGLISLYIQVQNHCVFNWFNGEKTKETLKSIIANSLINKIKNNQSLLQHLVCQVYNKCKEEVKYSPACKTLLTEMKTIYANYKLELKESDMDQVISQNNGKKGNPTLLSIKRPQKPSFKSHLFVNSNTGKSTTSNQQQLANNVQELNNITSTSTPKTAITA